MSTYTLTAEGKEQITGATLNNNNQFVKDGIVIEGTYTPGEPAVFDESSGEEVTPAVSATYTADGSVWTVSGPQNGGSRHRSSKKSKKGGNKYTMTMGGKKHRKSKKVGKKSKKSKKPRRY